MDQTTLLLARSFGIIASGLFSWSMIDLVTSRRLEFYLAPDKFEVLILGGGLTLGILTLLKLRSVVISSSHDHHGHSHDQVSLWRFIVLAIPLMIMLMKLTPKQLSDEWIRKNMSDSAIDVSALRLPPGRTMEGNIATRESNAKELMEAAKSELTRKFWQSEESPVLARLFGQFVPEGSDERYRLMRIKITCCAADATPIAAHIIGKPDPTWRYGDWLEVTGAVDFVHVPEEGGEGKYVPVVYAARASRTDPKPYIQ